MKDGIKGNSTEIEWKQQQKKMKERNATNTQGKNVCSDGVLKEYIENNMMLSIYYTMLTTIFI